MTAASYPPNPCRLCGRSDANWIVSALGCAFCFDPFAAAMQLALLKKVAEVADEVAQGRQSIDDLRKIVGEWKEAGAPLEEGRRLSTFPK